MTTTADRPTTLVEVDHLQADLDPSATQFMGAQKPASLNVQDLRGTGFTYRHNWGMRRGWWDLRLNTTAVGPNTRVFASAAEGPTSDGGKFLGNARYLVYNIAPVAGHVDVRIFIDWQTPIGCVIDYFIVNP
ncbi:hypothetical protein AB0K60_13205 [Thermopolyspora sp. NPDC052614]|uniref:hypothetical protein n=1 Tax=Thermopolyspora sp. NPDC052614 TaxID=3155682 RepID=UPI00343092A1